MRLGQLARKYGISKKEIISYLNEKDPSLPALGQNTKLDENTLSLIAQQFEDPDAIFDERVEQEHEQQGAEQGQPGDEQERQADQSEQQQDAHITELTADVKTESDQTGDQEQPNPDLAPAPGDPETEIPALPPEESVPTKPRKEDEVIATDKLLELLDSEEESVDLSKFTLIKAPKKELDGLKVVGKIDLPEPVKKGSDKDASQENERKKGRYGKDRGHELTEEEREKRRLKAKRKREAYEAREQKRRKEREKRRKKEANKARYQQKLQRAKVNQLRQQSSSSPITTPVEAAEQSAPPKTLLGKVWRWLTTY